LDLLAKCSPTLFDPTTSDSEEFFGSSSSEYLEGDLAFPTGLVGASSEGLEPLQRNLVLGDSQLTNCSVVSPSLATVKLEPQSEAESLATFSLDAQEEIVVAYSSDKTGHSIPKLLSPMSSCESESGYESIPSPTSSFDGNDLLVSGAEDMVDDLLPRLPDDEDVDMESITELFPDLF